MSEGSDGRGRQGGGGGGRRAVGNAVQMMVPTASTTEREAKFEVDRDYDPPDLRGVVRRTKRLPDQHLRTVYFDTPDRRLAERNITLRHRTTETADQPSAEETWTLKLPDSAENDFLARSETSWPGDRDRVAPPAVAILRGVLRRASLRPVAELDTTRRRLQLITRDNTTAWGELDDDLVSVVGGPGDGTWFRQVEVELTSDRSVEVDAVLDSLRRSGAKPTKRSKLSIALGQPPEHPPRRPRRKTRRRQTTSDIVTIAIASGLDRILDHDYRLRIQREQPHPHDVHQARVATRRLRSNLKLLAPVLDPVWLDHTTEELRWIADILGEIRDLDVLSANLSSNDGDTTDAVEVGEVIEGQRRSATKKLSTALNSRRYLDLLDRLNAAKQAPPLLSPGAHTEPTGSLGAQTKASEALPVLIGQQWRALKRQVRKANRHPNDRRLHKVRIRAKRLRYAAETAAPVIGKRAQKIAKGAEALQDLLGELRDRGAAERWLRQQAQQTPLSTADAFASGALAERQNARQRELRQRWLSEWERLDRKRNRKWLV